LGLIFEERSSGKKAVYFTDCKEVGEPQRRLAEGAEVVILDALQPRRHATHMSLDEAIQTAIEMEAPRTYFTHMAFPIDHETVDKTLPEGLALAWDGLRVKL
jgi:phosphoribosyl 1,2-cyclic phosphate phosphodiesterase